MLRGMGREHERVGVLEVGRRVYHALDDELVFRVEFPSTQFRGDDLEAARLDVRGLHEFKFVQFAHMRPPFTLSLC